MFLFMKNAGKKRNIPARKNIRPPMDPAAKANQKASFWPRSKRVSPREVVVFVYNILYAEIKNEDSIWFRPHFLMVFCLYRFLQLFLGRQDDLVNHVHYTV